MKRGLLAGIAVLALLVSVYGALQLRAEPAPEPVARPAAAPSTPRPQPPPKPEAPPAPPLPLPRLTVTAGDAAVDVKRRGATAEPGCATQGTAEPLCPGVYDVRALSPAKDKVALAAVRLNRGDTKTLELVLQPAVNLELLVLDADKLPVDRVNITAQSPLTGYVLKAKTDSDGTLSLGPVTAGDWYVSAQRDGFGLGAALASTKGTTKLQLGAIAPLSGITSPLASGVTLELATPEHVTVAETVTDAGTFTFAPVPTGRYELRARSPDFEPVAEQVTLPSAPITFRLSSGNVVEGELLGPDGEKLDSDVTFTRKGSAPRTVAARNGAFEVRALPPGRWTLSSGEGHTEALLDGGVTHVTLTVPRFDGLIAGTCSFDGGHRMPASVRVRAAAEDGTRSSSAACDGGQFEVRGLQRGFYAVTAEASEGAETWSAYFGPTSTGARDVAVTVPGVGRLTWRLVDENGELLEKHEGERWEERDVNLELKLPGRIPVTRTASLKRGHDTSLGDVVLQPGAKVTGRVIDAVTKEPIAGARVSTNGIEHESAADGTFTLGEASTGDIEVRAEHARYVTGTKVVSAPGEAGDVELKRATRVTGALITSDGRAPEGIDVWAMPPSGPSVLVPVENGAFATRHLGPGRWLLRAVGENVSAFDTVEVETKPGKDMPVLLVERAAGVTFEVAVTDRAGTETESDVLLVPRPVQTPSSGEEMQRLLAKPALIAETLSSGARFRFVNVAPGAYTLVASARGRVWTLALPLQVQPGMGAVAAHYGQVPYSP